MNLPTLRNVNCDIDNYNELITDLLLQDMTNNPGKVLLYMMRYPNTAEVDYLNIGYVLTDKSSQNIFFVFSVEKYLEVGNRETDIPEIAHFMGPNSMIYTARLSSRLSFSYSIEKNLALTKEYMGELSISYQDYRNIEDGQLRIVFDHETEMYTVGHYSNIGDDYWDTYARRAKIEAIIIANHSRLCRAKRHMGVITNLTYLDACVRRSISFRPLQESPASVLDKAFNRD